MSITVAWPTSLLIVVEAVLTLHTEIKLKQQQQIIARVYQEWDLQQQQHQQQQELIAVHVNGHDDRDEAMVLPVDEEDHTEVLTPTHLPCPPAVARRHGHARGRGRDQVESSIGTVEKGTYALTQAQGCAVPSHAYLPESSTSATSSCSSTHHHAGSHQSEQLPPYSCK
ncbi:hypothetical protein EDD11_008266 [Mortierella claussenii]|nr:hypothetical protein EDD11_008266 [Mortierella claussenii]